MVANFTASGKRRRSDDLTPGGLNTRRPDRAVIVYSNLIRRCFIQTRPIVLGGIEASLRRISHYDGWSDTVRRSILFDEVCRKEGIRAFLTYYLMAAHPGCTLDDMQDLRNFAIRRLHLLPEQVQIFVPTPSTYATLVYHTETDPFSGRRIFVEKKTGRQPKTKGRHPGAPPSIGAPFNSPFLLFVFPIPGRRHCKTR